MQKSEQTVTTEVVMPHRSRTWGIAWTNTPIRDERGHLVIRAPEQPEIVGAKATIRRELEHAVIVNSGNDWAFALFADGRRIVLDPMRRLSEARELLRAGTWDDDVEVIEATPGE